jgi:hypothetical protein
MRLLSALCLAALLGGCAAAGVPACGPGQQAMVSQTLYFGTEMPGGGRVEAPAWRAFLDRTVTPAFPQGFSVWTAAGQWRSDSGAIVQEPSYVLNIVHPDVPALDTAVAGIAAAYKRDFRQEAVLRVRSTACVSF